MDYWAGPHPEVWGAERWHKTFIGLNYKFCEFFLHVEYNNLRVVHLFWIWACWFFSENKLWYQPECNGSESGGEVGPSPRAFHVAVSIDCHMFIFGGRSGSKRYVHIHCIPVSLHINVLLVIWHACYWSRNCLFRLGDFWVLDTGKNMRLLYGMLTVSACHYTSVILLGFISCSCFVKE